MRLQSVSSSLGYQLHFNYGTDTAVIIAEYNVWKRLNSITAINTAVDYCNPAAHSCSLSQTWPTVSYSGDDVTDPMNRTTRYTTTASSFSIRRPSSSSDNVVYNYDGGGRVTSVVRDGLTWGYNDSLSGSIADHDRDGSRRPQPETASDLGVGLPTSVTDELRPHHRLQLRQRRPAFADHRARRQFRRIYL